MIVSELILALQKMPQDATVICGGTDYPEEVTGINKITKKNFDGYYYTRFGTNKNCVVRI